jgi:hypothetical protein
MWVSSSPAASPPTATDRSKPLPPFKKLLGRRLIGQTGVAESRHWSLVCRLLLKHIQGCERVTCLTVGTRQKQAPGHAPSEFSQNVNQPGEPAPQFSLFV